MKIVYNNCYGNFELSDIGRELYKQKKKKRIIDSQTFDKSISREDEDLISVVEELKELSWGKNSQLLIKEIDNKHKDGYKIHSYDGCEKIYINDKVYMKNEIMKNEINNLSHEECKNYLSDLLEHFY